MNRKFIELESTTGNKYFINVDQIVSVEKSDKKTYLFLTGEAHTAGSILSVKEDYETVKSLIKPSLSAH